MSWNFVIVRLAFSSASLLKVGWWVGFSFHSYPDVSITVGIWPILGLFIITRCVSKTLAFWGGLEDSAPLLGVPLSVVFVQCFQRRLRIFWKQFWPYPRNLLGGLRSCRCVANRPTARLAEFLQDIARPLVPCFLVGYPKLSEWLICSCKRCPRKSSPCLIVLSFLDGEVLEGVSSLLSDGISFVSVCPHVLWGG